MEAINASELGRISRQYRPALVAFFQRRVHNHAEAEDLTQEVFVRLARSKVSTADSPESYIFRIAINLLRDQSRRNKVRADYRTSLEQMEGVGVDLLDPHRIMAARDLLGVLWAGVESLPEPTQQIFILYRIENIDKATIAANYGLAVRTVEKHITKAMVLLAEKIGRRS